MENFIKAEDLPNAAQGTRIDVAADGRPPVVVTVKTAFDRTHYVSVFTEELAHPLVMDLGHQVRVVEE